MSSGSIYDVDKRYNIQIEWGASMNVTFDDDEFYDLSLEEATERFNEMVKQIRMQDIEVSEFEDGTMELLNFGKVVHAKIVRAGMDDDEEDEE